MNDSNDKTPIIPDIRQPLKNFLDRSGGLDPISVTLSDILPEQVFEDIPLN